MLRARPCRICRHWFVPDPRVGDRQHVCSAEACQKQRQREDEQAWLKRHPAYPVQRRMRPANDVRERYRAEPLGG